MLNGNLIQITMKDVLPGDMVLYVMQEKMLNSVAKRHLSDCQLSTALFNLLIKILKLYNIKGDSPAEILVNFQSTFVMPVDIYNEQNLEHIGVIQ